MKVTNKQGRPVSPGDIVFSFRGESGRFEGVSRGPELGRSAKVIVDGREYYANVWGLEVKNE